MTHLQEVRHGALPALPTPKNTRVLVVGGCWYTTARACTEAPYRDDDHAGMSFPTQGFRTFLNHRSKKE